YILVKAPSSLLIEHGTAARAQYSFAIVQPTSL
ncbi:hypothetical protein A2U01_0117902, partial [Trifolium medium]|nr:hypothetical protein [Trifolium medium]